MKEFNIEDALREVGFKVSEYDGVVQAFGLSVDGLGKISCQLHRNFNYSHQDEMCILRNGDSDADFDCLYMGLEPRTYEEFLTLMQLLFPEMVISKKLRQFVTCDVFKRFDGLDKYIKYNGCAYVPIIYKHENYFDSRSVWVMYAKENVNSFSRLKVLFAVKAGTLERALNMFIAKYDELCVDKIIRGREWYGNAPYAIDFCND